MFSARFAEAGPGPFRLAHLGTEPRLAACLRRVAQMSGWGRAPRAGRALGVGCAPCKDASWAAVVSETAAAEVALVTATLQHDPAQTLQLDRVAQRLGLGPRTLQRRLAAHGVTLSSIGRAVRVRHACSVLVTGDEPLPVVGFVSGFSDQPHFTRTFHRQTGLTPRSYRALAREAPSGNSLRLTVRASR